MVILYDLFFLIFSILYLPYFLIKGKWRNFSGQRLGIFSGQTISRLKGLNPIWIHAVSVGEVMASLPLYEEIKERFPSEKVIVSTVTSTGNRLARERFKGVAEIIYLPLDISFVTNKVVRMVRPKVVLIAETEIWPNFIASLKSYGAKIALFNGRISNKSFRRYHLLGSLVKGVLANIDLFLMQSQSDAERIISLGALPKRVKATGNLKYDAAFMGQKAGAFGASALVSRENFGLTKESLLLIAGSTHPGEEIVILRCYRKLIGKFPELRLLIAPRHVNRSSSLLNICEEYGFRPCLVSRAKETRNPLKKDEILILDIMGILSAAYSICDIAFIGGSLIKKGGQNPLEAAYYSKAIVFGPYTHNFEAVTSQLLSAGAAVQVKDEDGLLSSISGLLNDRAVLGVMGRKARVVLESNSGAAKRDIDALANTVFTQNRAG
ncbi:MAG: 3-deoxy-D-manno-octulosonic acid transferase [Candidatus Omnitrophota bacterium]